MLAFPEQLLHGRLPHRDFLHLYGPGSLWVLAAAYKVFGATLTTERVIGIAQIVALAFGVYALAAPVGRRIATLCGLTTVLILLTPLGLAALAWDGALAAAVCALALLAPALRIVGDNDRVAVAKPRVIAAGVLIGIALLYRPDMAISLGAATVFALVRMAPKHRRSLAWGLVPTVALYIPHFLTSGPAAAFRGMVIEPVVTLRPGRRLPVPPSWSSVDGYLQRTAALEIPNHWSLKLFGLSQQITLWFVVVLATTVLLVIGLWILRKRDASVAINAVMLGGIWSALLVTQAFQRPDTAHLAWVSGVSLPIMLAMWTVLLRDRIGMRNVFGAATAIVAVFLLAIVPFFPVRTYVEAVRVGWLGAQGSYRIHNGDRSFLFGSASGAKSAQAVVDELAKQAKPGQRLIVGTEDLSRTVYSDAFFYNLFPALRPGTRYIEMDPGIADAANSTLPAELRKNDWLILSRLWDGWDEPNASTTPGSSAANTVVKQQYCTVLDAEAYVLFRRCR
jgi:hypothetical protein